ncbi:acyltransferase family protein [Blastococcus sp. TF02A-30]|uniref:acyltransferase family protein n=1 Tax=Blastococcus sp. TF02A-30 TaxID=2250580 RepID=UPI000DEA4F1D|nr:acyltransferase family protein [Blastococcus sp. TF02A-30]RBY85473.1 acyltransferase [Blastococcus sp. TF02A-30]
MTTVLPAPATATPESPRRAAVRRPEIDGLRALAVALVVVYHVATGRVSGGVDVFLVLTGFFLVGSLSGVLRRPGRRNPLQPVARSLSRLGPAAFVVLAATVVGGIALLPETRWRDLTTHLVASATFTENVHLVQQSTQYAADDASASPMQQFWSLSIQVQVLVVVPLLVVAGAAILRRLHAEHLGRRLAVGVAMAVTAGSFAWSLVATSADQQAAYFSTWTRLWELGVGVLLALLLGGRRAGGAIGAVLGWAGVVGLIACGAVLDGVSTFPGWQAGWPVLCAVAILAAGTSGGRFGAGRALSWAPLQWLGRRAYGLYLWHWPILVVYLASSDRGEVTVLAGVLIVASSVLLAAGTYRLVEQPGQTLLRSRRPAWAVLLVLACAAPLVAAGATATEQLDRDLASFVPALDDPDYPGARALLGPAADGVGPADVRLVPPLAVIRSDWARTAGARCIGTDGDTTPGPLVTYECVRGPDGADRHIVLVGDSHAAHWLQPLGDMAEQRGWKLTALIHPGCNLSTRSEFIPRSSPDYDDCAAWRYVLIPRIATMDADVVVVQGTRIASGEREVLPIGYRQAWEQLSDRGIPVIAMRDTPRHDFDVPDCLAEEGDDSAACAVAPEDVYDDDVLSADLPAGVTLLDTRPYFCTSRSCPSVVGNIRVYMDDAHVTNTYLRTVRPLLEADFLALTGW